MKNKIFSFINAVDPIFLSPKDKANLYIAAPENTPQELCAKSLFPKNNLITFKHSKKTLPDTNKILKNKNFNLSLKNKKIRSYLLPHRFDDGIQRWSKTNKISLVAPNPKIQKNLEDKIYFDNLLKKYKINSPATIKNKKEIEGYPPNKRLVVQESSSYGFFGTKIFHNKFEFLREIKNKKIDFKNTLIREYISGPTVGVSIFIDKNGNYICSALRLQCFLNKKGVPDSFAGIQWLKTNKLSSQKRKDIERTIEQLAKVLRAEKYYGLANFDIILGDKSYVLECNPRLSSATPQIFFWSDLLNNNNGWKILIKSLTKKSIGLQSNYRLPNNTHLGSLLDIDVEKRKRIKNILPLGIYQVDKNINYFGNDINDLKSDKKRFFLYHDLPGKISIEDATACTAITNFPAYSAKNGQLNSDGKKIYKYLRTKFLG